MQVSQSKKEKRAAMQEKADWLNELADVRRDIENARARFNMATEQELIDQSVYELNALQSRYAYFLRKLKESEGEATAEPQGVNV